MKKFVVCVFVLGLLGCFSSTIPAGELTEREIIQKNIVAGGGKDKIEGIKSASIQIAIPGRFITRVYTQGKDLFKWIDGIPPIIEGIILIKGEEIQNKSYRMERTMAAREKSFCLTMQKLLNGAFTLYNFQDSLNFKGIKKLGPEQHYVFETSLGGCLIQFNLDIQTFLLKRMVIEDITTGDYKATYDFLPSEEKEGFIIPSGWYQCDLGSGASAEGTQYQLSEFKVNPKIDDKFFSDMELNMGTISVTADTIKGNLTTSMFSEQRGYGYFATNSVREDLEKLGLKANDKITVKIGDKEFQGLYITSTDAITASMTAPGTILLTPLSGSSYAGLIFFGAQFKPMFSEYQPLKEFTIIKK